MATSGQYAVLDNNNLKGLFLSIYEEQQAGNWAFDIGMYVPSDRETENYGWLGGSPQLEELRNEAKAEEAFNKFTLNLTNKEYAKAIDFRDIDLRRDKLGMIETRLGEFAQNAQEHWKSLESTLILNGTTSGYTAYDGVVYYSASHLESGTAQKNLLTSSEIGALDTTSTTVPTPDEAAKVLQGMIGWFYSLTDDKGNQINGQAKSFQFQVGTINLWAPLSQAATGMNLASGASNPVAGLLSRGIKVDVVLNPALSALTTNIFAFRTDSATKPFILQEEIGIDAQVLDETSDHYKKFRRRQLSLYTSRAAGYGRWQSALKATLS